MKKIFLLLFTVLFTVGLYSQLNITYNRNEHATDLFKLQTGCSLRIYDSIYQIVDFSLEKYDLHYNGISLGKSKQEALLTLDDLLSLYNTDNTYVVDDVYFGKTKITSCEEYGRRYLCYRNSWNVGNTLLFNGDVLKIKKWIEKNVK